MTEEIVANMKNGWGDRSRLRVHKFLPSPEVVPPDLEAHLQKVLACAASCLEVNVGIFLDVNGQCIHPWGRAYALTCIEPVDDPWGAAFNAVIDEAFDQYRVPFPVRIWISQAALARDLLFMTNVLAHELAHARQYGTREDLYLAWESYDRFLQERGCCLSQWHKPLEIDAELAARQVVRQLHGAGNLEELRKYYPHDDYEQVLEQERYGNFDAETCFRSMVTRADFVSHDDFVQWQRYDPDARDNSWLRKIAGELKSVKKAP